MLKQTITEIDQLVGSPGWWFSTIIVAVVVNIVSALIYEQLKSWVGSFTSTRLLQVLQISFAILVFVSSITMQLKDDYASKMAPLIGGVITFGILMDTYLETRYRFMSIITAVCIFCLSIVVEIHFNPPPTFSVSWFSIELFCSVLVASGVTIITTSILRMRDRRRAVRNYRA
jgi:hypothetical protein